MAGRPVTLTATDYELLRVLAQGAGRVLTHEALLRQVWAGRGHGKANPKIVRAYVKRLRHQLGDDATRAGLDRQRARGRLPHGPTRRAGRALTTGGRCVLSAEVSIGTSAGSALYHRMLRAHKSVLVVSREK